MVTSLPLRLRVGSGKIKSISWDFQTCADRSIIGHGEHFKIIILCTVMYIISNWIDGCRL